MDWMSLAELTGTASWTHCRSTSTTHIPTSGPGCCRSTRIVNSKALPLNRYSEVMGLAVGRLMDKSINVVKSAIQLLAAFIAHNPYSCKLSSADLKKPLEKETDKL